jgi:two-component system, probable response regulator PhcQ
MRRILLLDDEINVLHALSRQLRNCFTGIDLQIEIFTDPEQALLRSGETTFDVVISDFRMPAINGVDFLKTMKGIQPDAVRLVLSASTEFGTVMSAVNQAEVFRYIAKPWQEAELKESIELAFARHDQNVRDQGAADELRDTRRDLSLQELEAQRLEAEEPGITKVKWTPDGSVRLDD